MLSILIPTYNYDCTALVRELQRQITDNRLVAEVIVMDDASPDEVLRKSNAVIDTLPDCRLVLAAENLGRARTCNRLVRLAKYEYALILDSDVFPKHDDFLLRYIEARNNADAVNGGQIMRENPPAPDCRLRYKYGCEVECHTVEQRMKAPYDEFRTLNILFRREAFMQTGFDEKFVRYGHEDTLLGKDWEAHGFTISHIDNPVYHDVPDTNEVFLAKTHNSLYNLREHRDVLQSHVKLLKLYSRLEQWHLTGIVAWGFGCIERLLLRNLKGRHPSLFVFNLYKTGFLCRIMRG